MEEELQEQEFLDRCFQEMLEEEDQDWFIPSRDLPQGVGQLQQQLNGLSVGDGHSSEDILVRGSGERAGGSGGEQRAWPGEGGGFLGGGVPAWQLRRTCSPGAAGWGHHDSISWALVMEQAGPFLGHWAELGGPGRLVNAGAAWAG